MPTGYAHIACCLDGSDGSHRALEEASRLRELSGGRLSLVHVLELPPSRMYLAEGAGWALDPEEVTEDARRWLAEEAAAHPGAEAVVIGPAHAASAICQWAREAGVDVLVAGAHRGLLERALLGSFAGYLARHAPCAVLLARPLEAEEGNRGAGG